MFFSRRSLILGSFLGAIGGLAFFSYRSVSGLLVFGRDDRQEAYVWLRPAQTAAQQSIQNGVLASVALIHKNYLIESGTQSGVVGTVGRNHGLIDGEKKWTVAPGAPRKNQYGSRCPEDPHSMKLTVAHCSGFLVSDRHVMTAGHCFNSSYTCGNTVFVLGYRYAKQSQTPATEPQSFGADQVFKCKKIVASEAELTGVPDWAVVELDRPVLGVKPLVLSDRNFLMPGQVAAVAIGYPEGMPQMTATLEKLMPHRADSLAFDAEIDVFAGNSGSPLVQYDSRGEVLGIVVEGDYDMAYDKARDCYYVRVCKTGDCHLLPRFMKASAIRERMRSLGIELWAGVR